MNAPVFNRLNALTGDVAESPVLGILATADHIRDGLAECDRLRRDNAKLAEQADGLAQAYEQISDERDELAVRADELHQSLRETQAERDRLRSQLDSARAVENWHGTTTGGLR